MAYTRLSAAEAAAMINDQDTIGLSGFTPNGVPKATFRELSKRAVAEHEAGRPFQVGILTGASTSQSIEGDMAAAHAIKFRAPFSTNKDFRTHTNLGEIDYEDMHLGHMAERLRRGFYGEIDLAIIEVFRFGRRRNHLQGIPYLCRRHRSYHRPPCQEGAHREEYLPQSCFPLSPRCI